MCCTWVRGDRCAVHWCEGIGVLYIGARGLVCRACLQCERCEIHVCIAIDVQCMSARGAVRVYLYVTGY